ncbi:hypothetical protein L596_003981 [Steinernema carpocapsae]|uniref:Uncharacterized protein n=1 Tax=Steinernema carpocapsae TaxID=34508 RepID=A0A4U8UUD5_STECR|nr:hypothetical protein L596_003981 [Steinernema carpocapsae]
MMIRRRCFSDKFLRGKRRGSVVLELNTEAIDFLHNPRLPLKECHGLLVGDPDDDPFEMGNADNAKALYDHVS